MSRNPPSISSSSPHSYHVRWVYAVCGTLLLFGTYYATVSTLRGVAPAFARSRRGLKGSTVLVLYNGGAHEKEILSRAYLRLIKHVNSTYKV
ncbi:ATP-binding cassette long-chain fatty acid transporter pxa1 [Pleurotus ostreatus]|nr:ATP-binding cassette long-chain fatty acid transporter pxa1 [Pleurotus ostreatus]